jgi:hypothetical protein
MTMMAMAGVIAGPTTLAVADDAQVQKLQEQVDRLSSELAEMKQTEGEQWLNETRSAEVRALVSDVLADADTRANLMQSGMTAGYDNGAFLMSADGNFKLNIDGGLQVRYAWNILDPGAGTGTDSNRAGFENTKTVLRLHGHVVDPSWTYRIRGNFANGGTGDFGLQDAWVKKEFGDGFYMRAGQFESPFLREQYGIDDWYTLAAERSTLNAQFSSGRTQGIEVGYAQETFRVAGMWHDGFNGANSPATGQDTEYAIDVRGEFLFAGDWAQFDDFTSMSDDAYGFLLGAAIGMQKAEAGNGGPRQEILHWTVDAQIECGTGNFYAAIIGNNIDTDTPAADPDQIGVLIQGGWSFVPDEWELFARYEWGDSDITGDEDLSILTLGVNKYFNGHGVKWTSDVGIALDELTGTWAGAAATNNFRQDDGGQDGQLVLRTQLQLLF